MKLKILISSLAILFLAIFTGNYILGNISTQKLDAYLKQSPVESRPLYTYIKVNPLCSKVTFKNFSFVHSDTHMKVESEVLHVKMKYSVIMQFVKTKKVEKLTSLGLDFENVKISSLDELFFTGQHVEVDFDGEINRTNFNNLGAKLPNEKQELRLEIENGVWLDRKTNQTNETDWAAHSSILLNRIDYADVIISLDHSERVFDVKEIKLGTGLLKMEGNAMVYYSGQGWDDFKPSQVKMKYDCNSVDQMNWGEKNVDGRFTLGSFNSAFDGNIKLDDNKDLQTASSNFTFSLDFNKLSAEYEGEMKDELELKLMFLGLSPKDFSVEDFKFNTTMHDGRCVVNNTTLNSPLLAATLNADIDFAGINIDNSDIKKMEMRITNIQPNLQSSLSTIERTFGLRIPRQGADIVLEMKGSLNKPQIKGIHY